MHFETITSNISEWMGFGVDPKELTVSELCLRSLVVFITMYLMIRIAGRRFMAQKNAFDVVLAFLVASILARAVNGSASFGPNIALGFIIAVTYRAIAWSACKFPSFGRLLKGRAIELLVDGQVKQDALNRHHISIHDLEEDLRLAGNVAEPAAVKMARLERSGDISVERRPQVIQLSIKDGVKVVELRIK